MIKVPPQNRYIIDNSGDIFGVLNSSRNISFDNEGVATLLGRSCALATSADGGDLSDLGIVQAIVYYDDKYQVVTTDELFELDPSDFGVTINSESGNPSTDSGTDAVVWQRRLYVTSTNNLSYWNATTWTGSLLSTTSGVPHPLCVFENKNKLAVGNGNTVKLLNSDHSVNTTLTLPEEFYVTTMRWRYNNLYIGTKHRDGGEAKMFVWNGSGSEAQSGWGVNSNWIFSMAEYDSSVAIITNSGELLRFNGGGFKPLAALPVYYSNLIWQSGTSGNATSGKVLNRGMIADGDVLYLVIDGEVVGSGNIYPHGFIRNQLSGLWCFDPRVGLYPKSTTATDRFVSYGVSSVSSNTLTLSTTTKAQTGDPCFVKNPASLSGISIGATYFIIKVSDSEIKLAINRADAIDGVAMTISGSVASVELYIPSGNSFGDLTDVSQGAVTTTSSQATFPGMFPGNVIWSGNGASNSIAMTSLAANVGEMTTQRMSALGTIDTWQKVIVRYRNLTSQDKIVVKYKVLDRDGLPTSWYDDANWYDASSFVYTKQNTSISQVEVGDEVVLVSGDGAGRTAEISEIGTNSGNVTVSLKEEVPGITAGDTSTFYIDGWKVAGVIDSDTNTNDYGYAEVNLGVKSPRILVKLELQGHEVKVDDFDVINAQHKLK